MATRTTEMSVTFRNPFTLSSIQGVQPAGTYRVVTYELQRVELPFQAVERMTAFLHLPASSDGTDQVVRVDPAELADALAADAA